MSLNSANIARRLTRGERLVIATHNSGKLAEIRELLLPYGVDAVSAAALALPEPDETGATFIENAVLKSEAAALRSGLPALADDSGVAIDALNGEPGIHSARFAGSPPDFPHAMARLVDDLRAKGAVTAAQRRAHFVCALSLSFPGEMPRTFEARISGTIVWPPRGTMGFGYDPFFEPDGHTRTFGEMSATEKHGIPADGSPGLSHRARAFQAFARAVLPAAA